MIIRTATAHDLPELVDLLQQLFNLEVDFTPDPPTQRKGLELLLQTPTATLFVAEINRKVVGMCTLQILVSTAAGKKIGWIEDVVVHQTHRGTGIGSALLQHVEQWAHRHQLARLQLQADQNNTPARTFYRKQKWQPTALSGWWKIKPDPRP